MRMKIGEYRVRITALGVQVGCICVPLAQIKELLRRVKAKKRTPEERLFAKLAVGTRVQVVRRILDSHVVLGREGKVIALDSKSFDGQDVCVKFTNWSDGWGPGKRCWWVKARTLKVVQKKRTK